MAFCHGRLALLVVVALVGSVVGRECTVGFLSRPDNVNQTIETYTINLSVPSPNAELEASVVNDFRAILGTLFMPNSSSFVVNLTPDCEYWISYAYNDDGVCLDEFSLIQTGYGNMHVFLNGMANTRHGELFYTYSEGNYKGFTQVVHLPGTGALYEGGNEDADVTLVGGGDNGVFISTEGGMSFAIQVSNETHLLSNVSVENFVAGDVYFTDHHKGAASALTVNDDHELVLYTIESLFEEGSAVYEPVGSPLKMQDDFNLGAAKCDGRSWFALLASNVTDAYTIVHLPVNGSAPITYGPFVNPGAPSWSMDLWCH